MNVLIAVKLNFLFIPANLDFVFLVVINMSEKEQKLFFKIVIAVNIDILCSLFLISLGFFRKNRQLLDLLFKAVAKTIISWFIDKSKSQNYIPGIIAVLHTYGRDMKWNPHIHTIVTEGAIGNFNIFKKFDFISYDALRKHFQKILLDLLEKKINNSNFKTLKNFIYKKSNKGFYVYTEKKIISLP